MRIVEENHFPWKADILSVKSLNEKYPRIWKYQRGSVSFLWLISSTNHDNCFNVQGIHWFIKASGYSSQHKSPGSDRVERRDSCLGSNAETFGWFFWLIICFVRWFLVDWEWFWRNHATGGASVVSNPCRFVTLTEASSIPRWKSKYQPISRWRSALKY